MSEHTPGPWRVQTNRHPNTDGTPWGWVEAFPHPAGGGGSPPRGISNITWSWKDGVGKANAHLIAAAPLLLEAAEAALAVIPGNTQSEELLLRRLDSGDDPNGNPHAEVRAILALRTAINAAKGNQ